MIHQFGPLGGAVSGKALAASLRNLTLSDGSHYYMIVARFYQIHYAGFQYLVLSRSNLILSGSIMTSSFVWNQILLMCPLPNGTGDLREPVISFYCSLFVYRQVTNQNSQVSELNLLCKSTRGRTPFSRPVFPYQYLLNLVFHIISCLLGF